MNPYESPATVDTIPRHEPRRYDRGVLVITALLAAGWLTSVAAFFIPPLRDFLMPRFGWIGLFLSMNSLIFLSTWLWKPSRSGLFAASWMTCAIGAVNAWQLTQSGTVGVVQNVFHDRLPSAWLWSVASYLLAGAYLAVAGFRFRQPPTNPSEAG